MIRRCTNPADAGYPLYGGRGISVCERWLKFENFFADMGDCPDGMTIERERVNGNYEPGNCIWATTADQSNNRRGMKKYLVDGQWLGPRQLSRYWGVTDHMANKRAQAYPCKTIGDE